MSRSADSTASNAARSPDAMIERLPARTTLGFPLTGARRYETPEALASRATSADAAGETVLMSISVLPLLSPERPPLSPPVTALSAASAASDEIQTASELQTAPARG